MGAQRLDTALVVRGLARSRTQAARLIAANRVMVAGNAHRKPSMSITDVTDVTVLAGEDYVSRGAHKLHGALDAFGIEVAGRSVLDAGASTGGFTDLLLRRGARAVAAVDVGHGQLDSGIATDPRVGVHDGVNLRTMSAEQTERILAFLGGRPDLVVADVSFISLALVLPTLADLAPPTADLVPMVKPQFEVGKGRLGAGGVVRDARLRADAVAHVARAAAALGWHVAAVSASPLPGPSGNVEYFLHLRTDAPDDAQRRDALIGAAIERGPQ